MSIYPSVRIIGALKWYSALSGLRIGEAWISKPQRLVDRYSGPVTAAFGDVKYIKSGDWPPGSGEQATVIIAQGDSALAAGLRAAVTACLSRLFTDRYRAESSATSMSPTADAARS